MNAARLLLMLAALLLSVPAHAVTIDWVTVGDPGNANDPIDPGYGGGIGYGAVNYEYRIGKYEVTIQQYTDFLNAVAQSDPYSLYSTSMATDLNIAGISRSGTSGGYTYSVIPPSGATPAGAISPGNRPITYVSWFGAARFANWMHNGQGSGDTETGAYTLVGGQMSGPPPAKNPGAQFYIPTESEWYKAAYYSPLLNSGSGGYWKYAMQSNATPGNTIGSGANQANYVGRSGIGFSVTQSAGAPSPNQNYLTDVGAFTNSASYYGTFDQSGNVREWTDRDSNSFRGVRGGYWRSGFETDLSSVPQSAYFAGTRINEIGFRLASPVAVPEPSTWLMGLAGIACAGWAVRRRRSVTGERPPSTSRA
jgi:sulfatase modifying factor 1